jgi:hypothetical protein
MHCPECQTEYIIKPRYVAKLCGCDEEERILPFDRVYEKIFRISLQECIQIFNDQRVTPDKRHRR